MRIWVGSYNLLKNSISWDNCGLFIIDAPKYYYDNASNSLTISLLDLMAKLTGTRNGYLKGTPVKFSAGENIREAIIKTIKLGGFDKYIIENPPNPAIIPYDIDIGQGATIYDLLRKLVDLYPNYEMFFDINGTFIYQKIPNGINENVMIDDSLWDSILISEEINVDFQNIKNSIEIYGKTHNPAYFSDKSSIIDKNIKLNVSSLTSYTQDVIYGFTLTNNIVLNDMTLQINDLDALPVMLEDGKTSAIILPEQNETYYCVQFKGTYWNWLGHLQAYALVEDTNPNSPFYIEGTVGKIRLPLFGGEYENIYSDDLAKQRGEYELYLHTNMNDIITLTCIPVYWLEVNMLVQYTTKRNKKNNLYLIKSINMGLSPTDTMTVSLMKYYPTEGA